MRHVRRFERRHLLGGELDRKRGDGVVDLVGLGGADDRRRDTGLVQQPGQCHLSRLRTQLIGDLGAALGHREVGVAVIHRVRERIAARARRLAGLVAAAVARQEAARQRAPWDQADALVETERDHLALFLAVDEVVVVLHGHEARPAVLLGDLLGLGELPRVHRRRADVAGLAGAHDVIERLHRLFDRRLRIPAMDLIQIDVVDAQAAQRRVDAIEDVLARQAALVRAAAHCAVDLGRDHDLVARGERTQRPARDLLAHADRIDIGGVEEVDAGFISLSDQWQAGGFVEHPVAPGGVAVGHHAQADPRDLEAGRSEAHVFHGGLLVAGSMTTDSTRRVRARRAG